MYALSTSSVTRWPRAPSNRRGGDIIAAGTPATVIQQRDPRRDQETTATGWRQFTDVTMCNAATTRTYVGTYVCTYLRCAAIVIEPLRQYVSLLPSVRLPRSRSPKPISSPRIYLLPFPLSLSLFRRIRWQPHPVRTSARASYLPAHLLLSPGETTTIAYASRTPRGFRSGRSSPADVFSCRIRARTFARTRLAIGR